MARWVEQLEHECVNCHGARDHTDVFFAERVIAPSAISYRACATRLRGATSSRESLAREYGRLIDLTNVPITSFERKQYSNLSHEPNKAMNLNSYIALLGGTFKVVHSSDGRRLDPCEAATADLVVPDADYVLTLDADSVVLGDYALKLINIMQRDGTIAVAQTPYSAVPGSRNPLERCAGAQTDLQYIVHQGFTAHNATF